MSENNKTEAHGDYEEEDTDDSEQSPGDESHDAADEASDDESSEVSSDPPEEDAYQLIKELNASWDGDSDDDYGDVVHREHGIGRIKLQLFDNLDALDSVPEAGTSPELYASQGDLKSILEEWSQAFPTEFLAYTLSHVYPEEVQLTPADLRGKDKRRALHLLHACEKVDFCVYFSLLRRTIDGRVAGERDSSAAAAPPELTEIIKDEFELREAYGTDGLHVAENMPLKKGFLVQRTLINRWPGFSHRGYEKRGTFTHERTALILMPESNRVKFLAEAAWGGYFRIARLFYDQALKNPSNSIAIADFEQFCGYICDTCRLRGDCGIDSDDATMSMIEASLQLGLPDLFASAIEIRKHGLPPKAFRLLGKTMSSVGFDKWKFKDEAAEAFKSRTRLRGRLSSIRTTVNAYWDYQKGKRDKRVVDSVFRDHTWEEEGTEDEEIDSDEESDFEYGTPFSDDDTRKVDRRGQIPEIKEWEMDMIQECLDSPSILQEYGTDVGRILKLIDVYDDPAFSENVFSCLQNRHFSADIKASFLAELLQLASMTNGELALAFETICPYLFDEETNSEVNGKPKAQKIVPSRLGPSTILGFDSQTLDAILDWCEKREMRTCLYHLFLALGSYESSWIHVHTFWPRYIDTIASRISRHAVTTLLDLYTPFYQGLLTRYVHEYVGTEPTLSDEDDTSNEWKDWKSRQDEGKRLFEPDRWQREFKVLLDKKYNVLKRMDVSQLLAYEETERSSLGQSMNMNGKRPCLDTDPGYWSKRRG